MHDLTGHTIEPMLAFRASPRGGRLRWLTFGKIIPAITFGLLAGAQLELVAADTAGLSQMDLSHASLVVGRFLAMLIPFGMLCAYLLRAPAKRSDRAPIAAALGIGGAALPIAIPVAQRLLGLPMAPAATWQLLTANLVLCVSSIVALWALASLKTSFSILPEARTLRTAGPYALVRHPLYIAEILAACGTALVIGSAWAWVAVAVFASVQVTRAIREERVLSGTFEDYAEYRERTGMLFPRLRPAVSAEVIG